MAYNSVENEQFDSSKTAGSKVGISGQCHVSYKDVTRALWFAWPNTAKLCCCYDVTTLVM